MISNTRYWLLIGLLTLVYLAGLFGVLIENDSAQFAVMAKRMVTENDFLTLIKGTEDYLDKPHLHYWLAAFSFSLFGIEEWAYRLPALLATALGAYSCYGLGKILYTKDVGRIAALVFLSAQTIVLSNIDVRTDALLTGTTALALWQLTAYIQKGRIRNIVLGAVGAGLAFSTKGQIALLVIGVPLLCYIAYGNYWKRLLTWKILLAIAVFALIISPVLYAYYLQFDLHPEKVIRGKSGRSGIFFILWEQSFERLSGDGMGKNSSDYFFFFHSFLWVFLPWTVLGILAYVWKFKWALRAGLPPIRTGEFLTIGGITIIFFIISFAQFKLPHYLNIVIPLFAVLTAAYLGGGLPGTFQRATLGIQVGIAALVLITINLIAFYVFPKPGIAVTALVIFGSLILLGVAFLKEGTISKLITISALSSVVLNLVLNTYFYPSLLEYQGGSQMAEMVKTHHIPAEKIYKLSSRHTWAMDFSSPVPVRESTLKEMRSRKSSWLYVTDKEFQELRSAGMDWDMHFTVNHFRITRLQLKFLNPRTRPQLLEPYHLVRLR